jgi:hypothetical protein
MYRTLFTLSHFLLLSKHRDGLRAGRPRVRFPAGVSDFSVLHSVQTGAGAHPAPRALSPGLKRPGREADHSPPSSARSRMAELHLHSRIRLHGVMRN